MWNKSLIAGLVVATLGLSNAARADDCWTMLQKHFTWAQSDEWSSNHNLTFQMVTNSSGSHYASYAIGTMDVTSGNPWLFTTAPGGWPYVGARDGTQYFSDRLYPGYPFGPFSSNTTDVLGMGMTWYGQVTLTLKSWGGGAIPITGVCTNEMVIGYYGGAVYAFSFEQTQTAKIY